MNTAQGGALSSVCYVVVLAVCLTSAYRVCGGYRRILRHPHPVAVVTWLIVAVPSLVQIAYPAVFHALQRRPDSIEHGQVWRLVTSIAVQDGGGVGTVFNLVTLALTVPAAMVIWRPAAAAGLFLVGGIGFDLLATFVWNDAGGGNSAATFFLATATLGLLAARHSVHRGPIGTLLVVAAGIVLLVIDDAHGVAVLAGLAAGFALARTGALDRRGKVAVPTTTASRATASGVSG